MPIAKLPNWVVLDDCDASYLLYVLTKVILLDPNALRQTLSVSYALVASCHVGRWLHSTDRHPFRHCRFCRDVHLFAEIKQGVTLVYYYA